MLKGKVDWFNSVKGYGFITGEDNSRVFVHYTGIDSEGYKTLDDGAEVEYEIKETDKGPQAVNVKQLNK